MDRWFRFDAEKFQKELEEKERQDHLEKEMQKISGRLSHLNKPITIEHKSRGWVSTA